MSFEAVKELRSAEIAVEMCRKQLDTMRAMCAGSISGSRLTEYRSGTGIHSDRTANIAIRNVDAERQVMQVLDRYLATVNRAYAELDSVERAEFHVMLIGRYVDRKNWSGIGELLGCSESAAKKRFERYLKEYEEKHGTADTAEKGEAA